MEIWSSGPWDNEPKTGTIWVDFETNIRCETWRHPSSGHWCGYIYVQPEMLEPFKTEYGYTIPGAHGGITYYHEQKDGEIEIGFDCNHAWDTTPTKKYSNSEYRDLKYVECCIQTMARAVRAEQLIYNTLAGV